MNERIFIGKSPPCPLVLAVFAGLLAFTTFGTSAVHAVTSKEDVAKCERRFDKSPARTQGPEQADTEFGGTTVCIKLHVVASSKKDGSCDISARCYPDEMVDEHGQVVGIRDSVITVTPGQAKRVRNCDGILKLRC